MKQFLKDKGPGFYALILADILALITLVVYTSHYGHGPLEANIDCMSWAAFGFLLAGIVLSVAAVLIKKDEIASIVATVCFFVAFLFFAYGVYPYIAVVAVGIDIQSLSVGFLASTVLYVLTMVVGEVSVFLKKGKV